MKRETLEKVRRIAADTRGDPAMRAIAERIVKEYESGLIVGFPLGGDPRHPGLRPSPEYIRFKFFDLEHWTRGKGGRFHTTFHRGIPYRILLWRPTKKAYKWMRTDLISNISITSEDEFATITEAQEAAWKAIETMHSTPPSTKP